VSVTGLVKFGWTVEPFSDGIAGAPVRSGSVMGTTVAFTWDGKKDAGAVVPDGLYRISVWMADASDNRVVVRKEVTVDRRPAVAVLSAHPGFISPNGDGHSDSTTLSMKADEPLTGKVRLIDKNGMTVRRWTITAATSRSWIWNGRNLAGRTVADGRYTLRVKGLDRAGNQTISQMTVRVDRTIRSVAWSRPSFIPKSRQRDRMTFVLRRPAVVTVSITHGSTVVRSVWKDRGLAAGTHGWTWNGRTAAGVLLKPGRYRAVVTAISRIGSSTFTRIVVIRAP